MSGVSSGVVLDGNRAHRTCNHGIAHHGTSVTFTREPALDPVSLR